MNLSDYLIGHHIENDYDSDDFYGVLQGAMRLADTDNLDKLKKAFPEVWEDLLARYNAPEGHLQGDDHA